MRDPNRITEFMSTFQALWQQYPDLRFGQLVEILKIKHNRGDVFYLEDDSFLKWIQDMLEKGL